MTIRSSWNSDRVASSCTKKAPAVLAARPQYLFAQYTYDALTGSCLSQMRPLVETVATTESVAA